MAAEHVMFKFDDLKVNSCDDRQTEWKAQSADTRRTIRWSCCLLWDIYLSETMIKSAGTIEQKGVAQLLQIEEVQLMQLTLPEGQSPHA